MKSWLLALALCLSTAAPVLAQSDMPFAPPTQQEQRPAPARQPKPPPARQPSRPPTRQRKPPPSVFAPVESEDESEEMLDPESGLGGDESEFQETAGDESPLESESFEDEDDNDEDEQGHEEEETQQGVGYRFLLTAGGGMGSLKMSRPTSMGRLELPRSMFGAVRVGLGLHFSPEQKVSFETQLDYRTSVGFQLEVDPVFGLSERVSTRVQRVELVFAPVIRLGTSKRAMTMAMPMGLLFRAFLPKLHQFGVPSQVLFGPELRLELRAPISDHFRLRLGPEVVWWAFVDSGIKNQGASSMGFGLGGFASLEASVSQTLHLALNWRLGYSQVPGGDRKYTDLETFLTLTLGGRF